jgi:hypothetical protein
MAQLTDDLSYYMYNAYKVHRNVAYVQTYRRKNHLPQYFCSLAYAEGTILSLG